MIDVKRKLVRFSLRWVFILIALVAVALFVATNYLRHTRVTALVQQIEACGFEVEYHPDTFAPQPRVVRRTSYNGATIGLDRIATFDRLEVFEDPWSPVSDEILRLLGQLGALRRLRLGSDARAFLQSEAALDLRENLSPALKTWNRPKNLELLDIGLFGSELGDVLDFPKLKQVSFTTDRHHPLTAADMAVIFCQAPFRIVTNNDLYLQGLESSDIAEVLKLVEKPGMLNIQGSELSHIAMESIAKEEFWATNFTKCSFTDEALARVSWQDMVSLEDCGLSAEQVAKHAAPGTNELWLRFDERHSPNAHAIKIDWGHSWARAHRVVSSDHFPEEFSVAFFARFERPKTLIVHSPFTQQILANVKASSHPVELKVSCEVDQVFWDLFKGMPDVKWLSVRQRSDQPMGYHDSLPSINYVVCICMAAFVQMINFSQRLQICGC